jgi:hypothetical protein
VVDEEVVDRPNIVHRDPKPSKSKRTSVDEKAATDGEVVRPKGSCSKCGELGHNARSCGREPKGHRRGVSGPIPDPYVSPPKSGTVDRRDAIAKRAGSLPTVSASASFDTGRGRDADVDADDED